MKRSKLTLILLALVSLLIVLTSAFAADLTITSSTGNTGSTIDPGNTVTGTFDLKNDAGVSLTNIVFTLSLASGSNTILQSSVTFNPNTISLTANETKTIGFSIKSDQFQAPGTYSGNLKIDYKKNNTSLSIPNALTFSLDVNQKVDLKVDSIITVNAQIDQLTTKTFTVQNTGNIALTNLNLVTPSTITDNDNDVTTIRLDKTSLNLNPGVTETITITTDVSQDMDIRNYPSNLTISNNQISKTSTLNINVKPEICQDGPRGSALDVDVRDPDGGEEFAPGETIPVEINVDNKGVQDLDVEVEVTLYDRDKNDDLKSVKSTENIDEDEDKTFNLDLVIPTNVKESSSRYVLLIKVSEEDQEEDECVEEIREIEIAREDNDVVINKVTLTPSLASCGDSVTATFNVENVGNDDDDAIRVQIISDELKLNKFSDYFGLDDADGNDNEGTKTITFTIPEDAKEQTYQLRAVVDFTDGTHDLFVPLQVTDCEAVEPTEQVLFNLLQSRYNIVQGDSFNIQATLRNLEDTTKVFILEASPDGGWTNAVTQTVTLQPNEQKTVSLELSTPDNIEAKTHTLTLNLKSGGELIDSKTVTVAVSSSSTGPTGGTYIPPTTGLSTLFGTGTQGTVLFILADVVLVILAIYFLVLIFRPKKSRE